jgi:predicted secreted protein
MRVAWAALALVGFAALAVARKEPREPHLSHPVGADAVWQPSDEVLANIRKVCGGDSSGECLVQQMTSRASPAAVEFTRSIHGEGWLRDFRKVARVDVAYVEYPFRAGSSDGWLLVNGSPAAVDVDNLQKLPKAEMAENLAWSQMIASHPGAVLFPDDRNGNTDPLAIVHLDESQEFVVAYKVLDGCATCAQLGVAFLGYEFNPKSKLTGTEFLDFIPGTDSVTARPIHIHSGEHFSLALKGDAKHEWTLAQEPAHWILRSVNQATDKNTGTVSWNFEAISNGSTQMTLLYSSTDAPESGESLPLHVVAAPGLGH